MGQLAAAGGTLPQAAALDYPRLPFKGLRDVEYALRGRLGSADGCWVKQLNGAYGVARHVSAEELQRRSSGISFAVSRLSAEGHVPPGSTAAKSTEFDPWASAAAEAGLPFTATAKDVGILEQEGYTGKSWNREVADAVRVALQRMPEVEQVSALAERLATLPGRIDKLEEESREEESDSALEQTSEFSNTREAINLLAVKEHRAQKMGIDLRIGDRSCTSCARRT